MIGMVAFLGTPLSPWHALQTSNLAPNSACEAELGMASAAFAGAASAARTTRTPETVGKRLLIMFSSLTSLGCCRRTIAHETKRRGVLRQTPIYGQAAPSRSQLASASCAIG